MLRARPSASLDAFEKHLRGRSLSRKTAGLYTDWVSSFLGGDYPHTPDGVRSWLRTLGSAASVETARTALTHFLRFESGNPDVFISMERRK